MDERKSYKVIFFYREDPIYQILEPIQSPLTEGYRTKCEFTIGKNLKGEKTVGFLLGQYRDGVTSVLDPQECLHVSEKAKEIAKAMEVNRITLNTGGLFFFFFLELH